MAHLPRQTAVALTGILLAACGPAAGALPPTRTPLTLPTLRPAPSARPGGATAATPVVADEVQPTLVGVGLPRTPYKHERERARHHPT